MAEIIEITKENGMVGTDGGLDYLVIAEKDGFRLGIKVQVALLKGVFIANWRVRAEAVNGSAKGAVKAWPGIKFKKVDAKRCSNNYVCPIHLVALEGPDSAVDDFSKSSKLREWLHGVLPDGSGAKYTIEQVQGHMAETLRPGLNQIWGAVPEKYKPQQIESEGDIQQEIKNLISSFGKDFGDTPK